MPHYNHFVAFCYVRVEVIHRIKFLRYYLKANKAVIKSRVIMGSSVPGKM
jgi:hypothetical protein